MVDKAAKPFVELAESAGLKVERVDRGRHLKLRVVAEDGRKATFIAPVSPSDHRGTKNKLAQLRRFARGDTPSDGAKGRHVACAHCGADAEDFDADE